MIICGLSSGQTNLHPPIWGHGRQLDDRHRHPNINIREIIWLGNQLVFITQECIANKNLRIYKSNSQRLKDVSAGFTSKVVGHTFKQTEVNN